MTGVSTKELDRILKNPPPEPESKSIFGFHPFRSKSSEPKSVSDLKKKYKDLAQKESKVLEGTKQLSRERHTWNKELKKLESQIKDMRREKDKLEQVITNREKMLRSGNDPKQLKQDERERSIDAIYAEVSELDQRVRNREKELGHLFEQLSTERKQ